MENHYSEIANEILHSITHLKNLTMEFETPCRRCDGTGKLKIQPIQSYKIPDLVAEMGKGKKHEMKMEDVNCPTCKGKCGKISKIVMTVTHEPILKADGNNN